MGPSADSGSLSDLERNREVEKHLNLVYHVARKLSRKLGGDIEFEELVSAGTLGLIDALEKFDADRGHAFSTFAVPRIRGAILDEVRRLDPVPRSIRDKQRQIEGAQAALEQQLERAPSDLETASEMGVDADTLFRWRSETEHTLQVSIDSPGPEGDSAAGRPQRDLLVDEGAEGADESVDREQRHAVLLRELEGLEPQERTVLALYYYEELKLREIGDVLGLTVSRISQIRTAALAKLRNRLSFA